MSLADTIRKDFAAYTDPVGLLGQRMHPKPNDTGNGLMLTSEKIIIYALLGMLSSQDVREYLGTTLACRTTLGFYNRSPDNFEQESHDDLTGLAAASLFVGLTIARDIETFLSLHHWLYTVRTWSDMSWRERYAAYLGRFLDFRAHLVFCQKRRPNAFLRLCWAISVSLSGITNKRAQDPWRLTRLHVLSFEESGQESKLCRLACKLWRQRRDRAWPNGLSEMDVMYQNNNPNHPLAKYWPKA